MLPIGDGEIESIRAEIERALPDTCDILALTRTSDGAGGWTETWGTAVAHVPCRLDPLRGAESEGGGGLRSYQGYMLTLPYSTAVTAANRVQVGTVVYAVTGLAGGRSWGASARATIERV